MIRYIKLMTIANTVRIDKTMMESKQYGIREIMLLLEQTAGVLEYSTSTRSPC